MNLLMIYQSMRLMKRKGLYAFNHAIFSQGIRFQRAFIIPIISLNFSFIFCVLSCQSLNVSIV